VTINVGDTVEWEQDDPETPHTVTFPGDGAAPEFILVEGQPPQVKLIVNPVALAPAGGSIYSGTVLANSGFMPGVDSPQPGPRTYALTFDKPGTYNYLCVIHGSIGMVGSVTVVLPQLYLPLITEPP
jgi:plastocyanin